ncbi:hematopoietic SH2 domain-containing protein homolog isoform X2 [Mastacembelus armatus]|uniref:Hematopoietic SH2 domain containing n=2 Tax=Mastacembelus armatus TaxID=205130 RepID=A0A3Q3RN07_9TELE|nr:hematopoietic SH2 domain-containing protein homolog isoform X2 [Mastacembelus armatus]XP_026160812.1 hematopoietic SH2 domain-containing protein homolog isoform X2 [Mastacembelus armatus]XP_026160813.1 hematopoietic SH2 domain-containing protein homolog isoform X2 [Mastacembelus armatus]
MEQSQLLQGQHDAFTWFTNSQVQSVITNGIVPEWFHGIITRKTAEDLLKSKPPGYFLIRVSESRIGYTLSYRAEDRCRHFMIDVLEDGHYIVVGENRCHRFLQDLVDFHRRTPIMPFTEVLTVACGQCSNDKADYAELLFPQRHQSPNTSLLPNNSMQTTKRNTVLLEDIPPALPYRPNNLTNSQPNRLYPSLDDNFPHCNSPLPPTDLQPVPMTRKRYTADYPLANQPPEVPARSRVPVKQNLACVRTVSAPDHPSPPTVTEYPPGANIHAVKNQEAKPSVVTNLKNLKKKFQKKRSTSQEHVYTEINVESVDSEYMEVTESQTTDGTAFPFTCIDVTLLPQEYQPPPPFAPGY